MHATRAARYRHNVTQMTLNRSKEGATPFRIQPPHASQMTAIHATVDEIRKCDLISDTAASRYLDPVFIYGNKAAQRRFEYSWDEITRLPSRLSAEAPNRGEREQFLARVQRLGYETGYKGVRVTKSGQRFMIEEATLW
jgi:hypothetical protein